ncbi:hypothetical protein JCM11641_001322 [Rhodosporidiobolus odoratus]
MLPSTSAHPLSPPAPSSSAFQHEQQPLFPDPSSSLRSAHPSADIPLFPASPPVEVSAPQMARRTSAATLLGRREAEGIGLGLPGVGPSYTTARDEDATPLAAPGERPRGMQTRRASTFSLAVAPPSPTPDQPAPSLVPPFLALKAAPHLLPPSALLALPPEHLAALARSLSLSLHSAKDSLEDRHAEIAALEVLARGTGAGSGEVERAKVRARAEIRELREGEERKKTGRDGEWMVELGEFATSLPVADTGENATKDSTEDGDAENVAPAKTEADIDLSDLTEAISSNAFDLGLQPTSPSSLHFPSTTDDTSSIRSRALSLPFPSSSATTPPAADDKSEAASIASTSSRRLPPPSSSAPAVIPLPLKAQNRGRHASLSSRLFGTFSYSASTASSPPSSSAPNPPPLLRFPSSASLSTSPTGPPPVAPVSAGPSSSPHEPQPKASTRHARSAIIKSTRSMSSVTSTGGYGDWLWKAAGGWGGREGAAGKKRTPSIREGMESHVPGQLQDEQPSTGETSAASAPASETAAAEPDRDEGTQSTPSSRRPSSAGASTLATTLSAPISSSTPDGSLTTPERPAKKPSRVSPSRSPSSLSISASLRSPTSPSLSRTRSPGIPPTLLSAPLAAPAEATSVAEHAEGTIASPSPDRQGSTPAAAHLERSVSERSIGAFPALGGRIAADEAESEVDEDEERSGGTLRARASSARSPPLPSPPAPTPPPKENGTDSLPPAFSFVPGVPLYSASPEPSSPAVLPQTDEGTQGREPQDARDHGGYVATLSRALGLSTIHSGEHPTSASLDPSAPLRTSATLDATATSSKSAPQQPNLTLFPRLPALPLALPLPLSIPRYNPFSAPTLSTPATHVSLALTSPAASSSVGLTGAEAGAGAAGGKGASLAAMAAAAAAASAASSSSGGGTMELSTYLMRGEIAPPSLALALDKERQEELAAQQDGEGPMVDRYGFVWDVRKGMELLREGRRKKEEEDRGKGGAKGRGRKRSKVVLREEDREKADPTFSTSSKLVRTDSSSSVLPPPQQPLLSPLPLHLSSSSSPSSSPTPSIRSTSPSNSTSTSTSAPASSSNSSTGPQSMRSLLAQLRSINEVDEKKLVEEWEVFIRRRQVKLSKASSSFPRKDGPSSSALPSSSIETGRGKGQRRERPRPKTLFDDEQDLAALGGEEEEGGGGASSSGGGGEDGWANDNLVGVAQMGTEGKGKKEDWARFKELVRKGVPIAYRPKIWAECSSANEAREPALYQELLAQKESVGEKQCLKQIDMDCHRTFPTNVFFAGNGPGVGKLRNVLVAYSRKNPKVGYCQGMNNLVATLLLTHPAEEDAFWVLVCIVEVHFLPPAPLLRPHIHLADSLSIYPNSPALNLSYAHPPAQNILPSDYYTSTLLVSRADQEVLRDLTARVLPKVSEHLEEHGVELSAISFGWFLSLFTDVLPIQTLLRVWDLFFIHGTVLLFRIALAILKLHATELLKCESASGLYGLLGSIPSGLYHADRLLKIACEDLATRVKDKEVSLLRSKYVDKLQQEQEEREGERGREVF